MSQEPTQGVAVIATRFPYLPNLHTKEGRFAPFYVLGRLESGAAAAWAAIVEAPPQFNDPKARFHIARAVMARGARLSFRQAAAHFDIHRDDFEEAPRPSPR